MRSSSMLERFEPIHLKEANRKLDKHVLSAYRHKKTNDAYKKDVFKESLWAKIKSFLILSK